MTTLPPMAIRSVGAVLVAAAAAALGALILGEYEFEGYLPFVAGPLFGLVVAELVVEIGRSRSFPLAGAAAVLAAAGIAWAGWIDSSEGLEPVKSLVWVSAALAAAAAALRVAGTGRPHRRDDLPRDPSG